jgi:hypothetical protein
MQPEPATSNSAVVMRYLSEAIPALHSMRLPSQVLVDDCRIVTLATALGQKMHQSI